MRLVAKPGPKASPQFVGTAARDGDVRVWVMKKVNSFGITVESPGAKRRKIAKH